MSFADRSFAPDPQNAGQAGDVVLGDDWVAPDSTVEQEMRVKRAGRGLLSLKTSPLTRKIIMFNLVALNLLVGGILYLNYSRDRMAVQRAGALATEALLVSDVFASVVHAVGFAEDLLDKLVLKRICQNQARSQIHRHAVDSPHCLELRCVNLHA